MKNYLRIIKNKLNYRGVKILLLFGILITLMSVFYFYRYTQVMPQATISFFKDANLPSNGDKVLIFSPHPDDETIAVGGYIIKSIKRGAKVKIVLITNGNRYHEGKRRMAEFKKATNILGVSENNLVFLNFPDHSLAKMNQDKLRQVLKEEIDSYKPDYIIYPHIYDYHPDHHTAAKIIFNILKEEKFNGISYQYLVHHSRFPQPKKYRTDIFLMPPVNYVSIDNQWFRFVLTNQEISQKSKAIFVYRTQLDIPLLRSLLLSLDRRNELYQV